MARKADAGPFASIGVLDRLLYDSFDPVASLASAAAVPAARPRTRSAAELRPRAPTRRALCRRRPERRRRRDRCPAHRRRSAHDAAPAARVRGARCDRRLPPSPGGAPRGGAACRAHPGQPQPAFGCTSRTRRRQSLAPTDCSCSRSKGTQSGRSPGSPTPASSDTSGCLERCRTLRASRCGGSGLPNRRGRCSRREAGASLVLIETVARDEDQASSDDAGPRLLFCQCSGRGLPARTRNSQRETQRTSG
jgi:hypothetical protein